MAELRLSNGAIAVIDDEDLEKVSKYRWHQHNCGYSYRYDHYYRKPNGRINCVKTYLHREILGLKPGQQEVDHINGDPLDNRRNNLRVSNRSEQNINSVRTSSKSGGRGVVRCDIRGWIGWRAQLKHHGKVYYGGYYKNPRMAAFAYNGLAFKHFGPQFRFFNQVFSSLKE